MKFLTNIEKSGFHRGEYVGYSGSKVWRIVKSTSSFGRWQARCDNNFIYAWTLEAMSAKLEQCEKAA